MNDPIIAYVYEADNNRVFFGSEYILEAVFTVKSDKPGDCFAMMHKQVFIGICAEIGLLIEPKKKTPEEEKKEKDAIDKQAAG